MDRKSPDESPPARYCHSGPPVVSNTSKTMLNPFAAAADTGEADDRALVARIQRGDRDALELLVRRHQAWIYNVALRMLYHPQDAEDATQEILLRMLTKLSTYAGASSFRTWLYRVVVNHLLNVRREAPFRSTWTFDKYAQALDAVEDTELSDGAPLADAELMVTEAKLGCTTGMLLCLDREQRLIYILGEIFEIPDALGAEVLEISRENFRQRLARARRDLHSFVQGRCGLVDPANPCRCAKKTRGFIRAGYVDPDRLLFARARVAHARDASAAALDKLYEADHAYGQIYRGHPFYDPPDFVASLRELIGGSDFRFILEES